MATKTLYMETTEVPVERSAAEISSLLVHSGAREISTQYDGARVTGLRFVLLVQNIPVSFALPVRTEPVFNILNNRRSNYGAFSKSSMAKKDRAQAERVAWRQLLRWVQAQFAMIDTGMVQAHEVFLPYLLHAGSGQTLFESFQADGIKMLAAGQS